MSLKLHFLNSHMDECGEGSIRTFHKWKEGTVKLESKYVSWLLLESYKGDTNWWI